MNTKRAAAEIADQISERRLYADLGATPTNTIAAVIGGSLKKDRPSPFEKVQRGVFRLRAAQQKQSRVGVAEILEDNERNSGIKGRHKVHPTPANLTWKEAIIEVLRKADDGMAAAEIADQISERKLHADLGATPRNTIAAIICGSLKKDSPSPFEKVQRGVFRLREAQQRQSRDGVAEILEDNEKKSGIINAIGMFWKRDNVSWSQNPRILGGEAPNSSPIDFCNQRGVYLLHDAQGVVYVGQTRDQSLGKRLWQHTLDRHGGRWDRFSWFGIYGVNDDGTLRTENARYSDHITTDMVIISMEAVLIEAMEPRQNRQRGYDLQDHEYIQFEDPEISETKQQALLKEMTQMLHNNKS